jgi:F-type H+-transporting ATPase subunit a
VQLVYALEFPQISEVLVWPALFWNFNKIALINTLALILAVLFYWVATRRDPMVAPTGTRNMAEASVDFIEDGIVMQTMGRDGLGWTPFLLTLFVYIFLTNITGIIPILQMPANARMAGPLVLSLIVWVTFIAVGVKHQGPGGYLKSSLFPPGVPKALYILVTPIEFISTFLVRPFSLAVRLFANMLAGHILLVTFAVLTDALITANAVWLKPIFILPWAMLIFLTAFEVLVCVLQAYIFTILAAVYIGGSMHPEH